MLCYIYNRCPIKSASDANVIFTRKTYKIRTSSIYAKDVTTASGNLASKPRKKEQFCLLGEMASDVKITDNQGQLGKSQEVVIHRL